MVYSLSVATVHPNRQAEASVCSLILGLVDSVKPCDHLCVVV